VVTHLTDPAQYPYKKIYCARGDMENRIKEQQLGLCAGGYIAPAISLAITEPVAITGGQIGFAYYFPLAYILLENIRRLGLQETELAHAQASTIRLKPLKVGAVILRNMRLVFYFPVTILINRFSFECFPDTLTNNGVRGRCA